MKCVYGSLIAGDSPAGAIVAAAQTAGWGEPVALRPSPGGLDRSLLEAIHSLDYLDLLATAHDRWLASGREGPALPVAFPARGQRHDHRPDSIEGQLGYHAFDVFSPLTAETWNEAQDSAQTAITGATLLAEGEERVVWAIGPQAGHHAGRSTMGGGCFLNGAALAAQALRAAGRPRVTILDLDYRHGNGTQEIFWTRADVQTLSLHADPAEAYPWYLGYGDEHGAGEGTGFTHNHALPRGAGWDRYMSALGDSLSAIRTYGPSALVVGLGGNLHESSPGSHFPLNSQNLSQIGAALADLRLPVLFVQESGARSPEAAEALVALVQTFQSFQSV